MPIFISFLVTFYYEKIVSGQNLQPWPDTIKLYSSLNDAVTLKLPKCIRRYKKYRLYERLPLCMRYALHSVR